MLMKRMYHPHWLPHQTCISGRTA